jgi:hypothetical protein
LCKRTPVGICFEQDGNEKEARSFEERFKESRKEKGQKVNIAF